MVCSGVNVDYPPLPPAPPGGKPALQLWDYRPGKLEMGSIARSENE